jgi:hypothetical protein
VTVETLEVEALEIKISPSFLGNLSKLSRELNYGQNAGITFNDQELYQLVLLLYVNFAFCLCLSIFTWNYFITNSGLQSCLFTFIFTNENCFEERMSVL